MPSSHRRHRQDKTVLSCLIAGGVNRIGDSRRQFSVALNILETEQFCPVSSAVWTHLWTSLDPVSRYDVTIGITTLRILETGSGQDKTQFTPHFETGQNCFVIFSRRQSRPVANSVHTADTDKTRQDKTVLYCRCQQCELGIRLESNLVMILLQNYFVKTNNKTRPRHLTPETKIMKHCVTTEQTCVMWESLYCRCLALVPGCSIFDV